MSDTTMLDYALDALRRGFKVFPCHPRTKEPAGEVVTNGVVDATTSEAQIRAWWKRNPEYNPGVTGGVVFDCDGGLNTLQEAKNFAALCGLPATLAVRSGRRPSYGIQFHFTGQADNSDYEERGVTGEIRCRNQYGMAPGSIHPDTGERYEIVIDLPRAPCPELLFSRKARSAPRDYGAMSPRRVREQMEKHWQEFRDSTKGHRNTTFNTAAWFTARAFASSVLEGDAASWQQKLVGLSQEHHQKKSVNHERGVVTSAWLSGTQDGGFKLRAYVDAVESVAYCAEAPKETPFVVSGVIYQAVASLLMGPVKAGKSTFLLAMIKNILAGTDFIGQKTTPTNILYVTEQPRQSFQSQLKRSGLDQVESGGRHLYILDLSHLWSLNWQGRADNIRESAAKLDAGLVIIDTFPRIALIEEIAAAGEMNAAFELIAPAVVADGRSLLLGWHERKSGGEISEAAAGTVASAGAVDTLIRLRRTPGSLKSRDRQLELCGRMPVAFEEAVVVTLNQEMSNYAFLGTKSAASRKSCEQRVLGLLAQHSSGLTRIQIADRLFSEATDEDLKPPSNATLRRALDNLIEDGLLTQTGNGSKKEPFRYCPADTQF